MSVHKGLDVDDDLFAHLDAAFERLHQQALGAVAGHHGHAAIAALHQRGVVFEDEVILRLRDRVALDAMLLEQRLHQREVGCGGGGDGVVPRL